MRRERILLENAARPRRGPDLKLLSREVQALTAGDPDPMFVTVQLGEVGTRSRNDRVYPREVYERIVDTINAERPGGIRGHLADDQRSTAHPEMVWRWVSAEIAPDGKVWGKAYVLPTAKQVREEIRTAVATGAKIGTSTYATGAVDENGVVEAAAYVLEGIDYVHPSRVGIPVAATRAIVTAEMDQGDLNDMNDELKQRVVAMLRREFASVDAVELATVLDSITVDDLQQQAETSVHERALQECEFLWGGVAAEVQQDRAPVGIVDETHNTGVAPESDAGAAAAVAMWL